MERHDLGIVDAPKVRIRDVDATASVGRDLVPLPRRELRHEHVDESLEGEDVATEVVLGRRVLHLDDDACAGSP